MAPKIVTGIGCFLFVLSILAVIVSVLLPFVTDNRVSPEEAAPGYIIGGICSCVSFLPLGGGLVWLVLSRKKAQAG